MDNQKFKNFNKILTSGAELSPPSRFKTAGSTNRIPLMKIRPRSRRFYKCYWKSKIEKQEIIQNGGFRWVFDSSKLLFK